MDNMGYDKGLIRYTTQHELDGIKTRVLRPRIYIYGAVLLACVAGLFYSIAVRVPLELDIIRDRNQLYRETSDGLIENIYTLKVLNMDNRQHQYRLRAEGIDGLELIMDQPEIIVESGTVADITVRLRAEESDLKLRSNIIQFYLEADGNNDLRIIKEGRFLGPG
jgi:polyferredoxin